MHIFLSRDEKDRLSKWKYQVQDNSITTKCLVLGRIML